MSLCRRAIVFLSLLILLLHCLGGDCRTLLQNNEKDNGNKDDVVIQQKGFGRSCHAGEATPEFEEMIRMSEMIAHGAAQQQRIGPQSLSATPQSLEFPKGGIKLPLIFHVVTSGVSTKDRPSDEALQAQYKTMQNDFHNTGIQFQSPLIKIHENAKWAGSCRTLLRDIQEGVVENPHDTINVIFCDLQKEGALGIMSHAPTLTNAKSTTQSVAVDYRTVPGGPIPTYNMGRTLTHELGHLFGLRHTFEGGCSGGDGIDDTPAQASPTEGCPANKNVDTCPKDPGYDPVWNFMDYSGDVCMERFSDGQIARMQAVVVAAKPAMLSSSPSSPVSNPPSSPSIKMRPPPPHKPFPYAVPISAPVDSSSKKCKGKKKRGQRCNDAKKKDRKKNQKLEQNV